MSNRLSANAKRQLELTAQSERMLFSAAHQHFTVSSSDGVVCADIASVEPGTTMLVRWNDPRPDADVLKPTGPASGERTFIYIDGPTMAHELHASAAGLHDSERRMHRGLWLYASLEAEPSFFWSMALNFHRFGSCFPPVPERFRGDRTKEEGNSVYAKEQRRILESMKNVKTASEARVESKMSGLLVNFQDMMAAARETGAEFSLKFPTPALDASSPKEFPVWHKAHERHWGDSFRNFVSGKPAPCLWVLKTGDGLVGCQAGKLCPADHAGPLETSRDIDRILRKPVGVQENPIEMETSLVANGVACSWPQCPRNTQLVEETSLKRCSRCHNTTYCGADCQKGHWKEHKPDCRPSNGTSRESGNVWAIVLPSAGRRPYPVLLPVQQSSRHVAQLLGGRVALAHPCRGEKLGGVMLAFRVDPSVTPEDSKELGRALPDQSLPVNVRASGILSELDFRDKGAKVKPLGPASTVISGRGARCRGTAIALRFASPDMTSLVDFGNDDYNERWGLFACMKAPTGAPVYDADGDECAAVTLMPRTPEAEKALAEALSGRGPKSKP
jgi:hypothetical protein